MIVMKRLHATLLALLLSCYFAVPSETAQPVRAGDAVRHFRDEVRPLLIANCVACHNSSKKKADLDLSRRDTMLAGGESGAAVVPGNPVESLLYKKIAAGKMPPKGALAPAQIAVIKKWIEQGAHDDAEPLQAVAGTESSTLWSLRPIAYPTPPRSRFDHLASNGIDRFIFAKLQEKGLEPSPPAGAQGLLRRVTIDLTGLPPTPEDVEHFLANRAPDAYEQVVDRLLASPAYGERWGRHWLDVVRFGESHGYEQNHVRFNAWPYRDYVIRSFNEDKPYPDFIAEQLAGDLIGKGNPKIEAATGFLVAGVHDTVGIQTVEGTLQQRANDLEDIVATVGAAFLGMTIGCARCHDHKFDPIPQKDYYRLAAVFAGVRHGERELRTSAPDMDAGKRAATNERLRVLQGKIADLDAKARLAVLAKQGETKARRPAVNPRRNVETFAPTQARFIRFDIQATRDGAEPCLDEMEVFGPDSERNLALSSTGATATASTLLPGYPIHQVHHLNDGKHGNDHSWISNQPGKGWVQIALPRPLRINRIVWSRDAGEPTRYVDRLPVEYTVAVSLDGRDWQTVTTGKDRAIASEAIAPAVLRKMLTPEQRRQRDEWVAEAERLRRQLADQVSAKAYVGMFTAPDTIHLLRRGDVMQKREVVAPAALSEVPGFSGELAIDAKLGEPGRRLALARWLTDPRNPLTARVLVNRVWQHHFGRGLVATASDFGKNGTLPSHPELLDWLARSFIDNGWRLKALHRLIVTSQAYRQASAVHEKGEAADAGNQYLWRAPLRRLEAEALRDALLQTSGQLDRRMGGPGYALFKYRVVNIGIYEPLTEFGLDTWRRGVYSLAARSIRDDLLGSFDCPESAQRAPKRDVTTTPLQALSLLNGPFAVQQAELFARRVRQEAGADTAAQAERAFRLALGRAPSLEERQAALELISRRGLVALCRGLVNTNEFLYY